MQSGGGTAKDDGEVNPSLRKEGGGVMIDDETWKKEEVGREVQERGKGGQLV